MDISNNSPTWLTLKTTHSKAIAHGQMHSVLETTKAYQVNNLDKRPHTQQNKAYTYHRYETNAQHLCSKKHHHGALTKSQLTATTHTVHTLHHTCNSSHQCNRKWYNQHLQSSMNHHQVYYSHKNVYAINNPPMLRRCQHTAQYAAQLKLITRFWTVTRQSAWLQGHQPDVHVWEWQLFLVLIAPYDNLKFIVHEPHKE